MDVTTPEQNDGPLKGIKVIELTTMVAGPMCGQCLGDLGAEVIKIESLQGDTGRLMGPPWKGGLSGFFAQVNRNKRGISIDLKSSEGKQILYRMIKDTDVVVENYRAGVADHLEVGYDHLKEHNPQLIYTAVNGFGPSGPYAQLPAYDLVIQGLSGMMPTQGGEENPQLFKTILADKSSALAAASATLAALFNRERSGFGQRVDVPMMDAYAQLMLPDVMTTETFQPKAESDFHMPDLYHRWQTSDGFVVGLIIEDKQFIGICKALECEHLTEDPRFTDVMNRFEHYDEMLECLDKEVRKWPSKVVVERARANDAPFAPVHDLQDFIEDPQTKHNRVVFKATDPSAGEMLYVRHPAHYEKTPVSLRYHAPRLGEHSDSILSELGFSTQDITEFKANKVIG